MSALVRARVASFIGSVLTEEAIRAAFCAVLGRQPDPNELTELAGRARVRSSCFGELLTQLIQSPEAEGLRRQRLLAELTGTMCSGEVVSLGTHCFTSAFLARWGLKRWSGPFDWVFSSIPMITHCLNDDFDVFLDRGHFEPVPQELRIDGPDVNRVQHRFYRDRFGVQNVFNHRDVHLDEDYAYLERCVTRFRDCLKTSARKTFMLCSWDTQQARRDLAELIGALKARTQNFGLVAILVGGKAGAFPTVTTLETVGGASVYTMSPVSEWEPLRFVDPVDELCVARLLALAAVRGDAATFDPMAAP